MKFNKAEVALLASQPSHRLLLEGRLCHDDHGDDGHADDEDDTDDDGDSYASVMILMGLILIRMMAQMVMPALLDSGSRRREFSL